ncbi:hypothetical protein MXE27_00855 [Methanobacterium alcaliphilum]|nr:hypothetical protein [Methanobacterium alcaliphilum]
MFKKDVKTLIPEISARWTTIYLAEPVPPKLRLVEILSKLGAGKKETMKRFTIEELKDKIESETKNKKVIIAFNHFEKMTKTGSQAFEFLIDLPSIILVCSYQNHFRDHAYTLFTRMESFKDEKDEEVDIKLAVFAVITFLCIFSYLKLAFSFAGTMAFGVLAATWFGLMIFRTFLFFCK